jgi:hypothetical protein
LTSSKNYFEDYYLEMGYFDVDEEIYADSGYNESGYVLGDTTQETTETTATLSVVVLPGLTLSAQATVRTVEAITAQLQASVVGLSCSARVGVLVNATLSMDIVSLGFSGAANYDINVDRPLVADLHDTVHAAQPAALQTPVTWHDGLDRACVQASRWGAGTQLRPSNTAWFADGRRYRSGTAGAWQDGRSVVREQAAPWQDGAQAHSGAVSAWQDGQAVSSRTSAGMQDATRTRTTAGASWQDGGRLAAQVTRSVRQATPKKAVLVLVWHEGIVPAAGQWIPSAPEPTGRTPDPNLVFERPAGTAGNLVFNWSSDAIVVAARKVYIVINDVSLMRVDTSTYLNVLSLEISIDSGSWVHSWNATVAYSDWDALNAGYVSNELVELLATVNGHQWRLLAEGTPKRTRVFGQTSVSISGRGYAAWLDTPYADEVSHYNDSALTAQQLMALALTTNGVSLGWDLDWQITDWTVPAGLWSHTGSPIAGVLDVAASVQAIIQADPTEQILHVLPYYPASPWEWSTLDPDVVLPLDIIPEEDLEPVIKPVYNRVYVSGSSQGVIGQVTRTGTAGDKLAQMVTHPLITAEAAARQRGIAILGDSGHQAIITRQMPISTDTGLIKVGQLIKATETAETWRGLVRSVKVSANWTNDALVVRQAFDLERHYEL